MSIDKLVDIPLGLWATLLGILGTMFKALHVAFTVGGKIQEAIDKIDSLTDTVDTTTTRINEMDRKISHIEGQLDQ